MKITVRFFAYLKDAGGISQLQLDVPENLSVRELKQILTKELPKLDLSQNVIVAIEHQFADDSAVIAADSEVAFFPPVSGGSEHLNVVEITTDEFNVDEITQRLKERTTGAICVFIGVVRGSNGGKDDLETAHLEYEAYQSMAEEKMHQVCLEIRQRWSSIEGIAIIQRIGLLPQGTSTVLIACAASHRDTGAFEAARYGIDRLKEIVPIWKKEHRTDGSEWLSGSYFPHPLE
ncbi:MAG: molybdopterin converting factor [Anaerolineae bacterium]|nr:molybdopterin converting factor [Anaerolineae bacterium]